ncbi:unnamed protein product [Mycena citricolor]|uniref:CCHC-type domain-containing protein n=1 Tax=Mycena citricolor TaxID=2018698 RepID=A0AAD2K7L6_9AGAR|nr:unnamed protein product [Mycena citricolor]
MGIMDGMGTLGRSRFRDLALGICFLVCRESGADFVALVFISITLSSPDNPPVGVILFPVVRWAQGPPYIPLQDADWRDLYDLGEHDNEEFFHHQENWTPELRSLFGDPPYIEFPSLHYQTADVIEYLPTMSGIEKLNNSILSVFDGTNWNTWSDNYMSICMHQGTWGVVKPTHITVNGTSTSNPGSMERPGTTGDSQYQWDVANEKALGLARVYITQNLRKGIFMEGQRERTAREVFAKMATDYGQPNAIDAFVEYRLLNTTTFHGGDTIEKQIMEMETRRRQCSEGGIEIPDYLFATLMLAALPASSRGFVTSYLANRPIASLNPVDVKNSVIGNIKIENLDTTSNSKISTVPSLATRCTHCNKSGHVAASCYKKYPNLKPTGQSSDKGKGKQDEGKKKKKKEKKSGDGTSAVKEVVAAPAVAAVSNGMHISSYLMSDSLKHIDDGIFVEEMGDDSKIRFLWDSGCTHHMTNTRSDLHNIRPIDTYVVVGSGARFRNEAVGDIVLRGHTSSGMDYTFTLKDVIYNPHIRGRYLSGYALDQAGYYTVVGDNKAILVTKDWLNKGKAHGDVLMTFKASNRCYWYYPEELVAPSVSASHESTALASLETTDFEGVPPLLRNKDQRGMCDGCMLGKQHKHPYPASEKHASKPLELIHTDLMGPWPTQSLEGSRYTISFYDDFSSFGMMVQPMARLGWRTPAELWLGKKPDVSYFRVFGCKASLYVDVEKRPKGLEHGRPDHIFVGYERETKAWKVWDPNQRKI